MLPLLVIIITGILLFLMTILDIKYKTMPSILPSLVIFFVFAMKIHYNPLGIVYGLLGVIFALILWEFYYIEGIADLKAIVIISLCLASLTQFAIFMVVLSIYSFVYQFMIQKRFKFKKGKKIPFIPVLFCVYITMMLIRFLVFFNGFSFLNIL